MNRLLAILLISGSFVKCADVTGGCIGEGDICIQCNCTGNWRKNVNCVQRNFSTVPTSLPENLSVLNLYSNNITNISQNAFRRCHDIDTLILSNNNIFYLPDGLFNDTISLSNLHLQNNPLSLEKDSRVFDPIALSLKFLFIYNTSYVSEEVFTNLNNLTHLTISVNKSDDFGQGLSNLNSLLYLRLRPPPNTTTTTIGNTTFVAFENCTNLNTLVLENLGLSSIEEEAFSPLKNLTSLYLGYNPKLDLIGVSKTFKSLSDTIKQIDVPFLVNNYWLSAFLGETFYGTLRNKSNLEILNLSKNNLFYIDIGFPCALKHLRHLDISFNRLGEIYGLLSLVFTMTHLTTLNSNYQIRRPDVNEQDEEKDRFVSNDFLDETNKKTFKKSYSKETCVTRDINEIKCKFPLASGSLLDTSWCLACPPNLKTAFFKGVVNEQMDVLPPVFYLGNCTVENMNYASNSITMITGPLIIDRPYNKEPLQFDLSNNAIYCLAPGMLNISISRGLVIGKINLAGNELSEQLSQDDGEMFILYSNLTELNLADNKLKRLNPKTFSNLISLEILNLSMNSLQTIGFSLSNIPSIRILDLSSNLFVKFLKSQLEEFSQLSEEKSYRNWTIYLQDNPFQCSCDYIYFLDWILKNKTNIYNLSQVNCLSDRDFVPTSLDKVYEITRDLKINCNYALLYKILGGLVFFTIFCTLVGVTFHKYKWDIRYYLLKMTQKRKQYKLWMERTINYAYDAFVAYDQNDRRWIIEELIPNLEMPRTEMPRKKEKIKKPQLTNVTSKSDARLISPCKDEIVESSGSSTTSDSETARAVAACFDHNELVLNEDVINGASCFKFCIHERDFEAGNNIEANILDSIEQSRKVILLVSRHFLKSKWCRLELEMAKMESLERGRNIVITIFLEHFDKNMESLEWLIKRYTYLEWFACDSPRKQKDFWKRLRRALGETSPEKIVCDCGRVFFNRESEN